MERKLVVRQLGRVEYEDGLALMQALAKARDAGRIDDTLLLLEHPPVITMGRGAQPENVLFGREELAAAGIQLHETDRGGDVTYHGPGQLVGYPIFDLKPDRQDVRRYVRNVEEALIRILARYGIEGGRIPKWTGVWVGEEEDPEAAKVGAIGVHIKRWVTTHGFALNVMPDLGHFGAIVPCGITERGVTSMAKLAGKLIDPREVAEMAAEVFAEVFGCTIETKGFDRETVAVAVVRPGAGGPEVLILRRTPERGGFAQIVTGTIEAGEGPAFAAARELREETGLEGAVVDLGYVHAFGFGEGPEVIQEHGFGVLLPPGGTVRLDPTEHDELRWVPLDEALELLPFAGLRQVAKRAAEKLLGPSALVRSAS
jgi:lipoyl(octanoyl) transferase